MNNLLEQLNIKDTLIIGEVAQTHEGSVNIAHAFIDVIADGGANAVKFQTHIAAAESTRAEPWRVQFSKQDDSRYEYWQRMEFTEQQWLGLKQHADERGLLFMSSPFSLESVDLLDRIGMEVWKIASGEVSNDVLLKRIIETGKPVILSSGMSSVEEMDRAVALLKAADISFAVLQCTSSYPSTADKVGMNMVPYFAERYQCVSGISDHSGTIFPSLAAASHGGQIFEIHVTMSPDMFGPDVPVSLTKQELRQLVDGVAFNREMLANPVDKDTLAKELEPMRSLFNKSIVAKQAIKAGTTISEEHLTLKKPGTGLSAKDISQVVGKRLNCDYEMDQMISLKDLS